MVYIILGMDHLTRWDGCVRHHWDEGLPRQYDGQYLIIEMVQRIAGMDGLPYHFEE